MADYIYLLQNRLTRAQQTALAAVRDAARAHGLTVFLVGGAVRDLSSGAPVRDLDVAVQGDALSLRKELEAAGGSLTGSHDKLQSLYFIFEGGVRMEVGSTLTVTFPQPGKPAVSPATIQEDLRRRDFTANAMAISLNEGSYGLLMDPLNGIADTENRELRLVSNYGFIEDPARMIRAERLAARLGWQMEEKTAQRYQTGKDEGYISALSPWARSYELEEVFHEEEPLRVLRRLEAEGWMAVLFPALSTARANEAELERVRDLVGQLEAMGIVADPSGVNFPLLTAKLPAAELVQLKKSFARPGFVRDVESLEQRTKDFAGRFTAKDAAAPSAAWHLLMASPPERVLSLAYSSRSGAIQARFKAFFNDWPAARQRIPYQLMQEMRITPELPQYAELLDKLFFALMDGKLETTEAIRDFLAPYSPPAPAPLAAVRRRAAKRESKPSRSRAKQPVAVQAASDEEPSSAEEAGAAEPASGAARSGAGSVSAKAPGKPPVESAGAATASASQSAGARPGGAKRAGVTPPLEQAVNTSAARGAPAKVAAAKSPAAKGALVKGDPSEGEQPKGAPAKGALAKGAVGSAAQGDGGKLVLAKSVSVKLAAAKGAAAKPAAAKPVAAKGSVAKAPAKKAPARTIVPAKGGGSVKAGSAPTGSVAKTAAKKLAGHSGSSVLQKGTAKAAANSRPVAPGKSAAKPAGKQTVKSASSGAKKASGVKAAPTKAAGPKAGTRPVAHPAVKGHAAGKAQGGAQGKRR